MRIRGRESRKRVSFYLQEDESVEAEEEEFQEMFLQEEAEEEKEEGQRLLEPEDDHVQVHSAPRAAVPFVLQQITLSVPLPLPLPFPLPLHQRQ